MTTPTDLLDDTDRLIDLLQQQLALFEKLQGLGVTQQRFIETQDAEQLLRLVAHREQLIDQLNGLNAELEPFRTNWDRLWASLPVQQRQTIAPMVRRAQELLDQVIQQDERDRAQLEQAKKDLTKQLTQTASSSAVQRAYGGAAGAQVHRYTNRQG